MWNLKTFRSVDFGKLFIFEIYTKFPTRWWSFCFCCNLWWVFSYFDWTTCFVQRCENFSTKIIETYLQIYRNILPNVVYCVIYVYLLTTGHLTRMFLDEISSINTHLSWPQRQHFKCASPVIENPILCWLLTTKLISKTVQNSIIAGTDSNSLDMSNMSRENEEKSNTSSICQGKPVTVCEKTNICNCNESITPVNNAQLSIENTWKIWWFDNCQWRGSWWYSCRNVEAYSRKVIPHICCPFNPLMDQM